MPRRPAYLKKSVKSEFERLHRKCCYCETHQNTQYTGFQQTCDLVQENLDDPKWTSRLAITFGYHWGSSWRNIFTNALFSPSRFSCSKWVHRRVQFNPHGGRSSTRVESSRDHYNCKFRWYAQSFSNLSSWFLLGSSQNPLSCSDLIYHVNTLKLFHIPILQIHSSLRTWLYNLYNGFKMKCKGAIRLRSACLRVNIRSLVK